MRNRILSMTLALIMCLTIFSATVLGAEQSNITVSVTETGIKASAALNTEGYGSLVLGEYSNTAPQYALVDSNGNFIFQYGKFPCRIYLYDGIFVNGIITESNVYGNSGVYTLFDLTGKQVIADTYDYLSYYNGYGLALNRLTDGFEVERFLIDKTGKRIMTLPDVFNLETGAGGGDYMFEHHDWGIGYYGEVGGYSDGLLWFHTGVEVKDSINEAAGLTEKDIPTDRRWSFYRGGAYCGYMDLTGKIVIQQQYNTVYPFIEGLACVEGDLKTVTEDGYDSPVEVTKGKYGYIDKTGKTVIGFQYSAASSFSGGYAYVANDNGKYGYINKTGKVVVPMMYDSAFGAGDGLFSVGNIVGKTTNSWGAEVDAYQYGFVDLNGDVIVPLEYDDVSQFKNGVAYAIKDQMLYILKVQEHSNTPSDWAIEQVNAATQASIVPEALQSNYTKATNRAEFCALAIALYEIATGSEITERSTFDDTTDINVQKAAALGVVHGVGDNRFSPDSSLTREQAAAMLSRLAEVMGKPLTGQAPGFSDNASISSWAYDAVGQMQISGIMSGVGNNTFSPKGDYTREQSIVTMMRLYNIVK